MEGEMNKIIAISMIMFIVLISVSFTKGQSGIEWSKLIRIDQIRGDIQFIADDLTEGRAPGTYGEKLAATYIADRYVQIGLKPLFDTYFQPVPFVGITADPNITLHIKTRKGPMTLQYKKDMVIWTGVAEEEVSIEDAPLVFVGYGIYAPEYKWDDYKGLNVKGKIVVMFVNDPPATKKEPDLFEGRAMTYYGRWTYKYEEAARRGALGALLIHVTDMAGYPWQVVETSWTGEQVYIDEPQKVAPLKIMGWMTQEKAEQLFKMSKKKFKKMLKIAGERKFKPVDLKATLSVSVKNSIRRFKGINVVGYFPGSDETLKREAIVFTAHYDHLGKGTGEGDVIYNGAFDNASGVAGLLAVAEAFRRLKEEGYEPFRSVLFVAVTAEESGLLGSRYYAQHPGWPKDKLIANLNLDGVNVWGPTKDFVPMGYDRTSLEAIFNKVAKEMNIELVPDPFPEKGYFFRSDHFSFARFGIPAVSVDAGIQFIGKPENWGKELMETYTAKHYHQPSDEYDPSWPLTGAKQHVEFVLRVGWELASSDFRPEWKPGREVRIPE